MDFTPQATAADARFMGLALRLARRGFGRTSPNPMVGAVLVKLGRIIGRGWHHRAGAPHAEIEALHDAARLGHSPCSATLYVTLEPCCTHGRTPPCTTAVQRAGIRRVVVGATDPNPRHAGRAFAVLRQAGIEVIHGVLGSECAALNEAFNHWIVRRTPLVTVKAAMTLDGKIATASGESKWITGEASRAFAMKLRQGSDAILVGINTVLADDPSLTARLAPALKAPALRPPLRRIILDSQARTPLTAKVVSDAHAGLTTVVVCSSAPQRRVTALGAKVRVMLAPPGKARGKTGRSQTGVDLRWLLRKLGAEGVTSLLVEGGGETNASFLGQGFAQRVAFFYAPKVLGGRAARKGVAGSGAQDLAEVVKLYDLTLRRLGTDLLLTAKCGEKPRN